MTQPGKQKPSVPTLDPVQARFPASILRSREQGNKVNIIEPVNFRAKKMDNKLQQKRSQYTRSVMCVASKSSLDVGDTSRRRSKNIGQFFTDLASVKKKVDENLKAYMEDIKKSSLFQGSKVMERLLSTAEDFLEKRASQIWYVRSGNTYKNYQLKFILYLQ